MPTLRADRDFDDSIDQDWIGWWFNRAFGKTIFSGTEIFAGGREFHSRLDTALTAYFEYMWDQELGKRRDLQDVRSDAAARAASWIEAMYSSLIDARSLGDDMDTILVEFDNKSHRVPEVSR